MTLEEKAHEYAINNVCKNCNDCQSYGYIGCDTFRFAKKSYIDSANEMKCYANCKKNVIMMNFVGVKYNIFII